MMLDLTDIKERESKATKGEWQLGSFGLHSVDLTNNPTHVHLTSEDMKFIAHARQDIPNLIAEVEKLREALEFYADIDNYNNINVNEEYTYVAEDYGKKAQKALGGGSNE